jgi:lipoate-protein ligase B
MTIEEFAVVSVGMPTASEAKMHSYELLVEWRGREAFDATHSYQLEQHRLCRCTPEEASDRLVFVEHDPVITLGRQGDLANLPGGEASLIAAGIDFRRIERGGDVTYHGPGQLVGYPIMRLRQRGLSLREYMRGLEEALIRSLEAYGLAGARIPGLTGVWVEGRKLAAIGIALQGGVTYHGFALNVVPELRHFGYIVPCGIADRPVGSMSQLLGETCPALDAMRATVEREFRAVFGYSSGATASAILPA